ncbi:MAG: hypothetical protein WBE75_06525 [Candidatus Omnitrophota bacterium]
MKNVMPYKNSLTVLVLIFAVFSSAPGYSGQDRCEEYAGKTVSSPKNDPGVIRESLEKTKECYYSSGRYGDFFSFLKTLAVKRKDLSAWAYYYAALARYDQLAYLQTEKKWDEYFADGETYRRELDEYAHKAVKSAAGGSLPAYSRLLLWRSLREQQDEASVQLLQELLSTAREYAASTGADLEVIKAVAGGLYAAGERTKAAEFYKLYVTKMASGAADTREILALAGQFFKEGNMLLSELAYDAYADNLLKSGTYPKEEKPGLLFKVAGQFVYNDGGICDPEYAEKIFVMIESFAGPESFPESSLYTRAWNLEKSRSFEAAEKRYSELAARFPSGVYADEAVFKSGVIKMYALRDTDGGQQYLQKLADSGRKGPYVVDAVYHLALLLQWEGDSSRAAEYYNMLIGLAGKHYEEEVALSRARMSELAGNKPIEYNLRTFLELSFRPENSAYNMSRLDVKASPAQAAAGENISLQSSAHTAESGCMPVKLSFLWSGQTGRNPKLSADDAGFSTVYQEQGSHVINVVALHPSGTIDRSFVIVDVR